ncbi:ABC transporter permease [Arthrobacter castelli]|uniref:ABC transporter permease n=1 Tax=Arthrobacter castelli TaxID=271431 RepID=UPI00041793FA|nr:ABC transporter permease [Arthrobacter castelli]
MEWVFNNSDEILRYTGLHLYQSVVPLALGLMIAIPIGQLARQHRALGGFVLSASSVMYTVPSLALFVMLPVVLGTGIIDLINVIVALTLYAVALLTRSMVDALNSVDDGVRQAATAMGYKPFRRFFHVDLPLSVPVLFAGLRVVSVSNISLVSVGAVIGIPNLGYYFINGMQRRFILEIVTGIVLTLLLAVLMDLLLVLIEKLLTPWTRAAGAAPPTDAARAEALATGPHHDTGAAADPGRAPELEGRGR